MLPRKKDRFYIFDIYILRLSAVVGSIYGNGFEIPALEMSESTPRFEDQSVVCIQPDLRKVIIYILHTLSCKLKFSRHVIYF